MKPITTYVETILLQDDVAFESLKRGVLNMSQYAKQIRTQVADRRMEAVSLGSIITALSRLSDKYQTAIALAPPPVVFDQIALFGGLVETTYPAQHIPNTLLQQIFSAHEKSEDFFELTVGKNEITFITSSSLAAEIRQIASDVQPIVVLGGLFGITFRFSEDYFNQFGILYSILRVFALEKISITEFVSTYRESTVILSEDDISAALAVVKRFFGPAHAR